MTELEKFNHSKAELIEIFLDFFKIIVALAFGGVLSNYQDQLRGTLLPSFLTGILVAFITYNIILIFLNSISMQFNAFKEAKKSLSEGIACLLFLTWMLINSQTDSGVVMLYGAGTYYFFLTCTVVNTHIYHSVFKEYYDRIKGNTNLQPATPIRKENR